MLSVFFKNLYLTAQVIFFFVLFLVMSEKTIEVTEFALRAASFPETIAALGQGQNFSNVGSTGMKNRICVRPCSTYIIQ